MAQQLKAGTILQGGKYRIVSVLGQGGFGITYQAVMKSSVTGNLGGLSVDVFVTVKEFFIKDLCLRAEDSSYVSVPSTGSRAQADKYRQKFVKEAHNIAQLDHPNIVKVMDVFEENGTEYYVMQYLNGGSLRDYMKAHGPMAEPLALRYVMQIADALAYMHKERHLCHLDVKPGNILLNDGNAVLIDFGISKGYNEQGGETSSTPVGISDGYAPLEQYHNSLQDFSPESDVYSLGATLMALLTGQTPPDANYVNEFGLGSRPPYVTERTWAAIVAAMQPRRRDRLRSMDDFIDFLRAAPSPAPQPVTVPVQTPVVPSDKTVVVPPHVSEPSQGEHVYRQEIPDYVPEKSGTPWGLIFVVIALVGLLAGGFVWYQTTQKHVAASYVSADDDEEVEEVTDEEVVAEDTAETVDETPAKDSSTDTDGGGFSGSSVVQYFEKIGVGSYDYSSTLFTSSPLASRIRNLVGDTYFNYMQTHNDVITPLTKSSSGSSVTYSGSGGMAHAATWGYSFEYTEYGSGANSLSITITDEDDQQHHYND